MTNLRLIVGRFGALAAEIADIRIDSSTNSLQTITYPHHEKHAGGNYTSFYDVTGTSLIIAFKVENQTKEPHLTFKWKTEEDAQITLYKGATWTTNTGTDVAPHNSNDNIGHTSILQGDASGAFVSNNVVKNPTGLNVGAATIKYQESVWSTNQTPAGFGEGHRDERIFAPNETYAFVITATNGGIWLFMDWYEHTPRN